MTIPLKYRKSPLAAATFSFQELAEGQTYITLYGAKDQDGFFLTSNSAAYSDFPYTLVVTGGSGVYETILNATFATGFGKTQTLNGNMLVNVPMASGTSGASPLHKVTITVSKNATQLVQEISTELTMTSPTPSTVQIKAIKLVVPKTVFNVGDTLNIVVLAEKKCTAGANHNVVVSHDPANRNVDSVTGLTHVNNQMVFYIPVEADI